YLTAAQQQGDKEVNMDVTVRDGAWVGTYDEWCRRKRNEPPSAPVGVHHTATQSAEIEALRAEVERLQEAVRPKREDECLTLDHWRMRAYDLEANWSRCSRACAAEQTKREQAEARAERLAAALRHSRWCLTCAEYGWDSCDDGRKNDALLRDQEEGK